VSSCHELGLSSGGNYCIDPERVWFVDDVFMDDLTLGLVIYYKLIKPVKHQQQ